MNQNFTIPKPNFSSLDKNECAFKFKPKTHYNALDEVNSVTPLKGGKLTSFCNETPNKTRDDSLSTAGCTTQVKEVDNSLFKGKGKNLNDIFAKMAIDERNLFDEKSSKEVSVPVAAEGLHKVFFFEIEANKKSLQSPYQHQEEKNNVVKDLNNMFFSKMKLNDNNLLTPIKFQLETKLEASSKLSSNSSLSQVQMQFKKMLISEFNSSVNPYRNFILRQLKEIKGLIMSLENTKYGNLNEYLNYLEARNFEFTNGFYWDLFFEMFCGLKFLSDEYYIHLNVMPENYFVAEGGNVKLGNFQLSRKRSFFKEQPQFTEGDARYLAKETLTENFYKSSLNNRADIFSLGMSFIEILFGLELPNSGALWDKIRGVKGEKQENSFTLDQKVLSHSNLRDSLDSVFVKLIYDMIKVDPKERLDVEGLFEKYPQLKKRNEKLLSNKYKRIFSYDKQTEVLYEKELLEEYLKN